MIQILISSLPAQKSLILQIYKRVKEYVIKEEIDMIINCAAYTSVDKAEKEQILADEINHLAVANGSGCKRQ